MKRKFQNPGATVDLIIEEHGEVLLIKRKSPPFKGKWAFPGGFLNCGKETLEQAASRELKEETSLHVELKDLKLLGVYSDPNRDPRGHVISHVYYVKQYSGFLKAADDAKEARFFLLNELPQLAFDHENILKDYLNWRGK